VLGRNWAPQASQVGVNMTRMTTMVSNPTVTDKRSTSDFAESLGLAELKARTAETWTLANKSCEIRRTIAGPGGIWAVSLSIHVIRTDAIDEERRIGRFSYRGSITLWGPERASPEPKTRVRKWRSDVGRVMKSAGYAGTWHSSPTGAWGDFWKRLVNRGHALREAERLAHIDLPTV